MQTPPPPAPPVTSAPAGWRRLLVWPRRRWLRRLLWGAMLGLAALYLTFRILVVVLPLPGRLSAADATVVEYRDGTVAHVFLSADDRWRIAPTEVDPAYIEALIALEDRRFWSHGGVDPIAVGRAVIGNFVAGQRMSGASTLTMQLVRLLEPRPRTWRSKFIEAFRAAQLEHHLSKAEILHHYLRFVPYGRNLEGVEAASLAYFGHRADVLSAAEIGILLAVPQGPRTRAPLPGHPQAERRAAVLGAARDHIVHKLLERGALHATGQNPDPVAVRAEVAATPVTLGDHPFPREVRHAARWLAEQHPELRRIATTLDRGAQRVAEAQAERQGHALRDDGVTHASVVVVDHASGEVRALVGNLDTPRSRATGGDIAAFATPRATGSTLKPFIYAMAIDAGLVLPGFLVTDLPHNRGGWQPRNFDGRYLGIVRLEDALSRSLNVPFVDLLDRIGLRNFLSRIEQMGAHGGGTATEAGLAAAIGALELSPLDLATLYATLGRGGVPRPLKILRGADNPETSRVLGAGATWLTRQTLSRRDRPDFPRRRRASGAPAQTWWKTGTSSGHRDAWAAGGDRQHTAVVWFGNLDGRRSRALLGSEVSAPVLFDVLEGLRGGAPSAGDPPPDELVEVEVCAATGWPAGPHCPQRTRALALARNVPTVVDPFHHAYQVDADTGLRVGPGCRTGRTLRDEVALVFPADVRRYLAESGRAGSPLPAWDPACAPPPAAPPRIVRPRADQLVLRIPGISPEAQALPLTAEVSEPGAEVSWFVDGAWVGTGPAEVPVWWPPVPGEHAVRVVDAAGNATERKVRVQ